MKFASFLKTAKGNEKPADETRVSLSLLWHVLSNRGLLLSLADNLHNHQKKSPQDPYVVVDLSSLLSSGYCMPFHLAACCSRTVNSLIAGPKR